MYNSFNYNSALYNGQGSVLAPSVTDAIIFNDYSLQNSDIITQVLLQDSTPERDFIASAIPRDNGQIITGDFWRKKTIQIEGVIHKTTNALLEAELDAMKKALSRGEGALDVKIAGVTRRYLATLTNGQSLFAERKGYHVTFCPFKAEFVSCEPFAKSVLYNSFSSINSSLLVVNDEINNAGTAESKPVVILNFLSATSISAVSFKNNTTGEEIKITTTINANDYLKFDAEEMEVTINGVVQDYTGNFPNLSTDINSFTLTITGTSCVYDLTIKNKTCYL